MSLAKVDLNLTSTPTPTPTTTTAQTAEPVLSEYDILSMFLGPRAPLIYTIMIIGSSSVYVIWISLLILIWIISGFTAFIASLICLLISSINSPK